MNLKLKEERKKAICYI